MDNTSESITEKYLAEMENADAVAQNDLGANYYNGDGVTQDYTKAVYWFTKAAEQGHSIAQSNLGLCSDNGHGVPQDYAKAAYWYTQSAEQGYANAQNNLGHCYEKGDGIPQDYTKAVNWYTKSAEQGHLKAQNNLGYLYLNGYGVTQDYAKSVYWFTKAAEQGHSTAQCNLGLCSENGYGVPLDYTKAVYWYTKAVEQGYTGAQESLKRCKKEVDAMSLNRPPEADETNEFNIKKYLYYVFDTEKNVYMLEQMWLRLQKISKPLGFQKTFQKPQIVKATVIKRKLLTSIILSFILLLVAFSGTKSFHRGYQSRIYTDYQNDVVNYNFALAMEGKDKSLQKELVSPQDYIYPPTPVSIQSFFLFAIAIIPLVRSAIEISKTIKSAKNKNNENDANYAFAVEKDKNRVNHELEIKQEVSKYMVAVKQKHAETKQTLAKLYDLNIIHPQYRNLVAIASIFQYFDTGRCYSLEAKAGHEGAYNLYEAEQKQNMIISKLDTVIADLNKIQKNQYMLYNAINEVNNTLDKLAKTSQMTMAFSAATAANSSIIAQNTSVTAKNTQYLAWAEEERRKRNNRY